MTVDTGAFEDLAAKVAEMDARLRDAVRLGEIATGHEAEYAGMLARARGGRPGPRPARDRHGMRAITGGKR